MKDDKKEKGTCETCTFGDKDGDDMIWCEEEEQLKDLDESCCHWQRK